MTKIILASQSPRRREILSKLGMEFTVFPSEAESIITGLSPAETARLLAREKAAWVAERIPANGCVIGADTVVAAPDGELLGKPADEEEACAMLQLLQGRTHEVYTGVCVILPDGTEETFAEGTKVTFIPMSQEEIRSYVATGEPMDKAGAYGIQGSCAPYISGIAGDFYNVMGLPLCRLAQLLKRNGVL